jgi:hypothetical protein
MLTIVPLAHAVKTAVVVGYLNNQSQTPPTEETDSTSGRKLLASDNSMESGTPSLLQGSLRKIVA